MDDVWVEKLAIQEPCSRYCQTIDVQDSMGWAHCFTSDGAFEFDGHVVRGHYRAEVRTASTSLAMLAAMRRASSQPQLPKAIKDLTDLFPSRIYRKSIRGLCPKYLIQATPPRCSPRWFWAPHGQVIVLRILGHPGGRHLAVRDVDRAVHVALSECVRPRTSTAIKSGLGCVLINRPAVSAFGQSRHWS
jgi:SnoaL-like domain